MGLRARWKAWRQARLEARYVVWLRTPRDADGEGWIIRGSEDHHGGHAVIEYWDPQEKRWRISGDLELDLAFDRPPASHEVLDWAGVPAADRVGGHPRRGLAGRPWTYLDNVYAPPPPWAAERTMNAVPEWEQAPRWNGTKLVRLAPDAPGEPLLPQEWDPAARVWRPRQLWDGYLLTSLPQADHALLARLGVPEADRPASIAWILRLGDDSLSRLDLRVVQESDGTIRVARYDSTTHSWLPVAHEIRDPGLRQDAADALPDPRRMMEARRRVGPAASWLVAPRDCDGTLFRVARASIDGPLAVDMWDRAFKAWLRVPDQVHDAVAGRMPASDDALARNGVPLSDRGSDWLTRPRDWAGDIVRLVRDRSYREHHDMERWDRDAARWVRQPRPRPPHEVLQAPLATPAQLAAAGVPEAPAPPVQGR